jgi:hypothetical protein
LGTSLERLGNPLRYPNGTRLAAGAALV